MPTLGEVPRCEKCGRALATRMRREADRVRTYLECPDCVLPSPERVTDEAPASEPPQGGPPETGSDAETPPPR
jgi:hypothetical protein